MNFNKLERKYGRYAIPNLSLVIIAAYVLGYILEIVAEGAMSYLYLDPYLILHGQVWRLISWVLVPPSSLGIFTFINLFFFYYLGKTLESLWGDFRYNLYIIGGIFFVIVGCFLIYFFGINTGLLGAGVLGNQYFSLCISYFVGTYYINISVIMAFAMTIPDMQIRFMFFIPMRMKWLAYIEGAFLLLDFIAYQKSFPYPSIPRCVMVVSMLNFFVFYFFSKNSGMSSKRKGKGISFGKKKSHEGFSVVRPGEKPSSISRHKCAICGKTEITDSNLMFRFCSKCNGNYEYCEDHLYTHEHIQ